LRKLRHLITWPIYSINCRFSDSQLLSCGLMG